MLADVYPDLTPSDKILCALLLMRRSNSDIKLLLGISGPALRKRRSRLKVERFGLGHNVELEDFLFSPEVEALGRGISMKSTEP